jgi:hypothetical protein
MWNDKNKLNTLYPSFLLQQILDGISAAFSILYPEFLNYPSC